MSFSEIKDFFIEHGFDFRQQSNGIIIDALQGSIILRGDNAHFLQGEQEHVEPISSGRFNSLLVAYANGQDAFATAIHA